MHTLRKSGVYKKEDPTSRRGTRHSLTSSSLHFPNWHCIFEIARIGLNHILQGQDKFLNNYHMNQKGFVNIIIIVIVVALVGAGAYFVLNRQIQLTPTSMPTPTPGAPKSGPITVIGEITCLSKKGGNAQTFECAIGLKGLDGRYYGLKNLFKLDPEYKFSLGGLRVKVSGTFSPEEIKGPDGNKYDVVGVIYLTSIKEIGD